MKQPNLRSSTFVVSVALVAVAACKGESTEAKTETPTNPTMSAEGTPTPPADIPPPADVAAPPADAQKTASGLAWKVLEEGAGPDKPQVQDRVEVHYTGWTTDGKMFDSSRTRGKPAGFSLRGVIPGWTEGLQLIKKGDKARFWIPKELAYNDQPGRPAGMLVFDVELLSITPGPKPIPAPEDVAAAPADAKKLPSGLAYKILAQGDKEIPGDGDQLQLHFTGWALDGQMVTSTKQNNRPANMVMGQLTLKGWNEGLAAAKIGQGGSVRMWLPQELALGDRPPAPGIKPGPLTFDVELLKIGRPPKTPSDVKAAPASAKKTASGLAYKVIQKGTGKAHPTATDKVTVHYTGWTTDGKMFDSSVTRGEPTSFPLNGVIKGWTEGVQLMVEGEKTRFWIPAAMAYGDNPGGGRPGGLLVFDIELIKIGG